MKKIIIGIGIMGVLIIGGLSINLLPKGKQLEDSKEKVENKLDNFEGKNIIVSNGISDKYYKEDFSNLVNVSDAVVKGKVKKVEYTIVDGNAWTKLTFNVNDIFKGNIKSGEDIDIYYKGGYISLEDHIKYHDDAIRFENLSESEIKNTVIKETLDGEVEFVQNNEELILCLLKARDYMPFPKDSYERLYASGMLKEQNGKYVQLYGEIDTKYSVSKNNLNSIKKLEEK